ncbi:hypothetical protein OROHE_013017 [Orobanche hederae]
MASDLSRFVVDARDHILEPFVSFAAKDLLYGTPKVVMVLRCETLCVSGRLDSLKIKYSRFRGLTPSMFLWETIRGCIPDETEKGNDALARLEVHEGVPPPYDNLKILDNVKNGRTAKIRAALRDHNSLDKYCWLGTLCTALVGRPYDAIEEMRKKRKERSRELKKQLRKLGVKDNEKKVVEIVLSSQLMCFHFQESSSSSSSHMLLE